MMKPKSLLILLCINLFFLACQNTEPNGLLTIEEVSSTTFLGGTLISSMEDYAFFESALRLNYKQAPFQVRNIAWPADDIFGLARSQFGSAQNTQSWQPPTAEEGYGSKVLLEHLRAVDPTTLFLGYGTEAAYFKNEEDLDLFKSGYTRLLDTLEAKSIRMVLISPPKQEASFLASEKVAVRNEWLHKVSDFIQTEAEERDQLFVDLFNQLITDPTQKIYTHNGLQLNEAGYQKMAKILCSALEIPVVENTLNKEKSDQLINLIKEKNRLYRYILQPLNEAYIYLFRRHEMGHLASEMEDLKVLINEKEDAIHALANNQRYNAPPKEEQPWTAPKTYEEHEVPAFIPSPNVDEEIAAFNISDGFEISLFAADPMIANPININWDTKGRAWVATSSTYPHIVPGKEPNDKIIILEDTNGDGQADKHTVFAENLLVPHSVIPVPGGAYVVATTELLFLADTDGDDVADERRVIFDGFGNADVHHTIHGFRWTPWGDLHFTQSIYINSFITTVDGIKILNGSGTWSFRPETEQLEVFSRGLVNPWGEGFDEWGQAFATDGAGGSGINYIFPESAHMTAVGAASILQGLNSGTPKNTAAEVIYSRHFPQDWQGSVVTNDYRANRTVRYAIKPYRSGYTSKEVETVLHSDHRSYRPVDTKIGPDGALYVVDWYNPIIAHGEVDFHHPSRDRLHGRIWKLTQKNSPLLEVTNYSQTSLPGLLALLKAPEQFTRLQANRAFVERKGDPLLAIDWINNLDKGTKDYARYQLEGLWLLTALNHYDEDILLSTLRSNNPRTRAAAVRMLSHWNKQANHLPLLKKLILDNHPQVRLEAIHALRNLGTMEAAEVVMQVRKMPLDENLKFALELTLSRLQNEWLPAFVNKESPFGGSKNDQLYALLLSEDQRVVEQINQLINQPGINKNLQKQAWSLMAKIGNTQSLEEVLQKAVTERDQLLLQAMVRAPKSNTSIPGNLALLTPLINDKNQAFRLSAIQLLGRWNVTELAPMIKQRLKSSTDQKEQIIVMRVLDQLGKRSEIEAMAQANEDKNIQGIACLVWAEKDLQAAVASTINTLSKLENPSLVESIFRVFTRNENGPAVLTKALSGETIHESIAETGLNVVQTSGLPLGELEQAIRKAGNINVIGMELSREEKSQLIAETIEKNNIYRGRKIFQQKKLLCRTCHRVQNLGGLSGPDLSTIGTFMTPSAILDAILNPNNDIKQGYETVVLTKTDGEVISGLLDRKTDKATLIRLAKNEIVEVPETEIAEIDVSPISLMPAGLTRNLSREELKDLLGYLMSLGVN